MPGPSASGPVKSRPSSVPPGVPPVGDGMTPVNDLASKDYVLFQGASKKDAWHCALFAPRYHLTPGLHHVVNDGVCSYADFAEEAARQVGADPALVVRVSSDAIMRAPRPRFTPMSPDVPMRGWKESLAEYVSSIAR